MSGTASGFNLKDTAPIVDAENEGTVVELQDAKGNPMFYETGEISNEKPVKRPVTITVAGSYSKIYKAAALAQRERQMKSRRTHQSGESLFRQQIDLVAACVLAWEGIFDGEKAVPLTAGNVATVLEAAPWIREQVEEAQGDHAGFTKSKP